SVRMFLVSRDGGDAMVHAMHRHDTGWSVGEEVSRRPSFSEACDIAVALCGSDTLLFLNAGTVPLRRRSIHELLAQVGRPDVAAAGGKVFDAGGTMRQSIRLVATHESWDAGAGQPAASPGPMNLLWLVQNASVLACDALAVRRDRYREVGGWPAGHDKGAAVEILCQRLGSAGYRLVWTPFSEFGTAPSADDSGAPVAGPTSDEYESYDMYRAYRRCRTLACRMPRGDGRN
ncbi:MAG TPA: hypothetical protein VGV14_15105, partial [Rhodanobacter sp.]|nr:hypothetical protein [Rhodanobacter sp.]